MSSAPSGKCCASCRRCSAADDDVADDVLEQVVKDRVFRQQVDHALSCGLYRDFLRLVKAIGDGGLYERSHAGGSQRDRATGFLAVFKMREHRYC